MSRIKTLRDGVKDAVAAMEAVTDRSITPVVTWTPPERSVDKVAAGGEIWIAPAEREVTLISRGRTNDESKIHVAIMQPLGNDPDAKAEANQVLAEAIMDDEDDGIIGKKIGNKTCISVGQLSLRDVPHWREKRLFTTVLELGFK